MDGADSGNGGVVAPQAPRHDGPPSTTNDQVHTTLERREKQKPSTMLHEIEIINFQSLKKKKKNQKVTWRVNISPLSG
jgi:hypothetical protein